MLDIGWSELLVIGVVALLVVGPKELPVMLRVIGRYVGMVKRQADEFREQFSSAMEEADLAQLRKDVSEIKEGAEDSLRDVKNSFDEGLEDEPLKTDAEKLEDAKRKARAKAEEYDDDEDEDEELDDVDNTPAPRRPVNKAVKPKVEETVADVPTLPKGDIAKAETEKTGA